MSKPTTGAEFAVSIPTETRPRRTVRRTRALVALAAAAVVMVAGGLVGADRLLSDGVARGPSADPASDPAAPSATLLGGPLDVSGSGVGTQPFGTDADEVLTAVAARFGEPDLTRGPQRYARMPGSDAWFEDADDPISPSWQYSVTSASCWGVLCLIFGGDAVETLQLRGWVLAQPGLEEAKGPQGPDVRLAGTGLRLGDSWARLHAAYPDTVVAGGEGASVAVRDTPWPAVSDGVGGWRLSGSWDFARPTEAPAGAVVTRLSGGEGPEPGCC